MCIRDRGTLTIGCKVLKTLRGVWRYVLRPSKDLFKVYGGKGAWAIITGGSSGIGLAYAKELAKAGFNLLLIARDQDRLEEKRSEILKESGENAPEIQTISFDFSKPYDPVYYSTLEKAIENKSIAILVNNVGVDHAIHFKEFDPKDINTMLTVNINAVTFLTHMVIPIMEKRTKRSAIIGNSSTFTQVRMPCLSLYAAGKSYMESLLKNLHHELKSKGIDVLVCRTGETITPSNPISSIWHNRADVVAKGQLSALGYDKVTAGILRHALYKMFLNTCFSYWFKKRLEDAVHKMALERLHK
eukprot:TRINITY_DN9854_c0_g1_i3.p1 TRINITY_DN9854_c0_g1~~TRINITY_DN9854_c0_g1_i3.p1  ORF type:complete len:301 (+),score=73.30 TRINITY_DN9854_c0_g1_i3:73-975(+)